MVSTSTQVLIVEIVLALSFIGGLITLILEDRKQRRMVMAIFSLIFITVLCLMINKEAISNSLGWSVNFSNLKDDHLMKYDVYSDDLNVGIISDQEGSKKGDRRLVKNIPTDLKPGELFVIREGKVFTYKTNLIVPTKPTS